MILFIVETHVAWWQSFVWTNRTFPFLFWPSGRIQIQEQAKKKFLLLKLTIWSRDIWGNAEQDLKYQPCECWAWLWSELLTELLVKGSPAKPTEVKLFRLIKLMQPFVFNSAISSWQVNSTISALHPTTRQVWELLLVIYWCSSYVLFALFFDFCFGTFLLTVEMVDISTATGSSYWYGLGHSSTKLCSKWLSEQSSTRSNAIRSDSCSSGSTLKSLESDASQLSWSHKLCSDMAVLWFQNSSALWHFFRNRKHWYNSFKQSSQIREGPTESSNSITYDEIFWHQQET